MVSSAYQKILLIGLGLLTLALGFLAYHPGLTGGYMFDDFPMIVHNHALSIHSLAPDQLLAAALSEKPGPLRRPLSFISFALNRHFFGAAPYSFKLTNVIIHLLVASLLFAFTWLLLDSYRRYHKDALISLPFPRSGNEVRNKKSPNALTKLDPRLRENDREKLIGSGSFYSWASLAIAAAWALHPLNLTAVLFIWQRMTSLCALFMVAAMCVYLLGRRRLLDGRAGSGHALIWLVTPLLGGIAVLTKETAALTPLYLLAVEALIFRFRDAENRFDHRIGFYFLLGIILPIVAGLGWVVFNWVTQGAQFGSYNIRPFTPIERLLTESRIVMHYLHWSLLPNIQELALYHDDIGISHGLLDPPTTLLSIIAIAGLLVLAWCLRRKAPLVSLGIFWFFAGQVLESTVLPLELVHEHRNYLADYGIILACFSLLLLPRSANYSMRMRYGATVAVILALASVTFSRSLEWSSNLSQALYAVDHHPKSARSVDYLGRLYGNLALAGVHTQDNKAYRTLEHAMRIDPVNVTPEMTLVMLSAKLKQPVKPAWLNSAAHKLRTQPISAADVTALDQMTKCLGHSCPRASVNLAPLFKAAANNPRMLAKPCQKARLVAIYTNYLTAKRRPVADISRAMQKAVNLCPSEPQYRVNLARLAIVLKNRKQAARQIIALERMNQLGQLTGTIASLQSDVQSLPVRSMQ